MSVIPSAEKSPASLNGYFVAAGWLGVMGMGVVAVYVASKRYTQLIYYIAKVAVTAVLVVLISEISKRSSFVGAVLASVPLTSVLAMLWLYIDTGDVSRVTELASSVFWLVLPSLALFVALPILLSHGVNFYLSLGVSIGITAICYLLMVVVLRHYGIEL